MYESAVDESALRRAIADAAEEVLISTDSDDLVTSWNAAAERLYGYNARDMIGPVRRR